MSYDSKLRIVFHDKSLLNNSIKIKLQYVQNDHNRDYVQTRFTQNVTRSKACEYEIRNRPE